MTAKAKETTLEKVQLTCFKFENTAGEKYRAFHGPSASKVDEILDFPVPKNDEILIVGECGDEHTFKLADIKAILAG